MTVILFLIILGVLIFVHELGHFLVAKWTGMLVHTFAIGFPPTLYQKTVGETTYKANLIPLGGYVSIHGQDPSEEADLHPHRAMHAKYWWKQASVLVAGVTANMIFAWVILSLALVIGAPTVISPEEALVSDSSRLFISYVVPGSPAESAGIMLEDEIIQIGGESPVVSPVSTHLLDRVHPEQAIELTLMHPDGTLYSTTLTPAPVDNNGTEEMLIGIGMIDSDVVKLPLLKALKEGFEWTTNITKAIWQAVGEIISSLTHGKNVSQSLSGPIGIVGEVHNAQQRGFVSILILTAVISINLALLNIMPFPALDGGRLLMVSIEKATRKPFPIKVATIINAVGFGLLILLMVFVTINDVIGLVGV